MTILVDILKNNGKLDQIEFTLGIVGSRTIYATDDYSLKWGILGSKGLANKRDTS